LVPAVQISTICYQLLGPLSRFSGAGSKVKQDGCAHEMRKVTRWETCINSHFLHFDQSFSQTAFPPNRVTMVLILCHVHFLDQGCTPLLSAQACDTSGENDATCSTVKATGETKTTKESQPSFITMVLCYCDWS
jgi:hypothetical protein